MKSNKLKVLSIIFFAAGSSIFAQDLESAKKAIDAEQYEKAKSILKTVVNNAPDNGKAAFYLGKVYLQQSLPDSAKIFFQKGITAKDNGSFNYIGLGQLDLDNANPSAAQLNFDQAVVGIKKKDIEPLLQIGKAYTNSTNPNYKKAIEILTKAKTVNPNDAQTLLALGDAYYGDKNQNEAYSYYLNAFGADNTLLRAKMQLGVLLKGAKAFAEAKAAFDAVLAINSNYGPVYRELAETYFGWALIADKTKYKEYTAEALSYYEKYMSLTDYSLSSRMRHADFLIIAKDYKALEKEANEMKKLDKVNPRILRYLGYSAYENGNYDSALDALTQFTSSANNKLIGRDYLYLGLAQLKKATTTPVAGGKPVVDPALYKQAVDNLQQAVNLDKPMANELNDIGKVYFDQKLYKNAAGIYEVATSNPNSKNFLYDSFFLGYSLYFDNADKDLKTIDVPALQKADKAFANVITASPTTQDAHIYRARVNLLLTDGTAKEQMAKSYEDFITVVNTKGGDVVANNKTKLIEAYQELAKNYAKTDKVKANDYIAKALVLDPTDTDSLTIHKTIK